MSNFFEELSNLEGKVKFQQYQIKLLTEEFGVLVPFASKAEFFQTISDAKPTTKKEVVNILRDFNGRLEE